MGPEIERRFRVAHPELLRGLKGRSLLQGYLSRDPERTVRLRLAVEESGAERGWLTVKGPSRLDGSALVRMEWEVELPPSEVRAGLALCLPQILEKTRLQVEHAGHHWDVDVFHGANEGLVLAEIELASPGEIFQRPPWLGEELGPDFRFSNASLSETPWCAWSSPDREPRP